MHSKALIALSLWAVICSHKPPRRRPRRTKPPASLQRGKFQQAIELEQATTGAERCACSAKSPVRMTPQVRFHIGVCEENLGRLAVALGSYELALARRRGRSVATSARVTQKVNRSGRNPENRRAARSGSRRRDHRPRGALGSASIGVELPVDPGPHAITARAPGLLTVRSHRTRGGRRQSKREVELARTPSPDPLRLHSRRQATRTARRWRACLTRLASGSSEPPRIRHLPIRKTAKSASSRVCGPSRTSARKAAAPTYDSAKT